MQTPRLRILLVIGLAAASASQAIAQTPLGSEFTYKGALRENGEPVNDSADFQFTLWDADVDGAAIGSVVAMNDVLVVDGVFTVTLDFGVVAFNGDARWLEVAVRSPHDPSDTQAFTTLAPRQPLTAAPYALQTRGLFVDDSGHVGIGTVAPSADVHVKGGAALMISSSAVAPTVSLRDDQDGDEFRIVHARTANQLRVRNASNTNLLVVEKDGNVGIGTTTPATLLDVDGTIAATQLDVDGAVTATQLDVNGTVTAVAFVGDGSGLTNIANADPAVGTLVSWGSDFNGVISDTPTEGAFVAVDAGHAFTVAIDSTGALVGWGNASVFNDSTFPLPTTGTYVAVAAGFNHGVAIRQDGTLVSFGSDTNFEGYNNVPSGTYVSVAAGLEFSTAVRSDGVLVTWGYDGADQVTNTPTTGTYVSVSAGNDFAVALATDGTLVSWGHDGHNQVSGTPTGNDFVAVSAGSTHAVAIRDDGSLVSWGANLVNLLSGTPTDGPYVSVSAGREYSLALRADGQLVAWGPAQHGQVNQAVTSPGNWTAYSAGGFHVVGIRDVHTIDAVLVVSSAIGVGRETLENELEVEGDASKSTAGAWLANSDRRIKTGIETISGALDTLDKVRLVSFEYTDDYKKTHAGVGGGRYLNVIAQEFAEVFPEHVKGSGEKLPDGSEILQVDTYPLTIYSAAAIQELHQQLRAKDAEIQSLREQSDADIGALNQRIARLESMIAELTSK